jgi:hypothetical protein
MTGIPDTGDALNSQLLFVLPRYMHPSCHYQGGTCPAISYPVVPGDYQLQVITPYGESNFFDFQVTGLVDGNMWLTPRALEVAPGQEIEVEVHVKSDISIIGEFAFHLSYPDNTSRPHVVINDSIGDNGVEAGPDGFLTTVISGDNFVTGIGSDVSGTGPGSDLHIATIHFIAGNNPGNTYFYLDTIHLRDPGSNSIGQFHDDRIRCEIQSIVANLGDVNEDGSINIVDALLVAQYYVKIPVQPFNPVYADVNRNGKIDIIDALLIAQYYVKLIPGF